ncbi:RNA polymerase II-associated protein 3 [Armigeres subalbatus]|uniref:RNA polymerase II-associated protein 3 n=1 Tax=Armigeres subalbatus TaxID=124917 RepID=UPI002ED53609
MSEAIKAQLEVKSKCEQMQQSLKELHDWEQDMKRKEAQSRQQKEERNATPIRSNVDKMNKFAEDQLASEKLQLFNGSIMSGDMDEAEHYNNRGNELCKMAKGGADASSCNEKIDLEAIDMYSRAIDLNNQKPEYYVNRAHRYFKLERYEECISDCNSAIEIDNSFVKAYYRRMLAYEYIGNSATAYLECQSIMKMAKDSGDLARTKQDMQRIEARLRTAADKHKTLGNKHLASKDYQQASDCFSKAISTFPYEPIYYNNRGLAYYHLKDYDGCMKDCNEAIKLDENYFRPYYRRALIHELHQDYQAAIKDLEKFLQLAKDEKQSQTAKRDVERIQRLLQKQQTVETHDWNNLRKNASVINFVQKAPHLRSKKPLNRIAISEVSSTDAKSNPSNYVNASDYEAIPDSVIDKIFNNNTGERVVEPKVENNLENLFPSSSMSKLKQLFSPVSTPSSPPSDTIGESVASCKTSAPIDNKSNKASINSSKQVDETKSTKSNVNTQDRASPLQQAEQTKKEKEKTNQGNCSSETTQEFERKLGDSSQADQAATNSEGKMTTMEKPNQTSSALTRGVSGTENPTPPIPSSSVKFYHSWCNLKTSEEKYHYLKTLENASLHKLLGVNIGCDMLSDILQVLKQFCLQDKTSPLKILSEVAKNEESGILIMMLGEKDKYALIQLLDLMDELNDDKEQVLLIRKTLIV